MEPPVSLFKKKQKTYFFPEVTDAMHQIGNHIWGNMSDVSLNSLS